MKKYLYIIGMTAGLAVAVGVSYAYMKTGKSWLTVFAAVAVLAILVCIVGVVRSVGDNADSAAPRVYTKKKAYISVPEREFLHTLRAEIGNRYEIFVQVPLVSVVDKKGGAFRNELFRVVDYVVVHPTSYEPLLLIELNDASHNRADRMERDRKVAEICAAAKIPLVAFTLEQSRNIPEVRKTISKLLR